jgi:hypothetical protein
VTSFKVIGLHEYELIDNNRDENLKGLKNVPSQPNWSVNLHKMLKDSLENIVSDELILDSNVDRNFLTKVGKFTYLSSNKARDPNLNTNYEQIKSLIDDY